MRFINSTVIKQFYLPVSDLHTLYVECVGNPKGIPIVFLHGGPGSGLDEMHRHFFDPEKFFVVLFDQRGCGKSMPYACCLDNTTDDLVSDLEMIRQHLLIDAWHVFGGSWGSFLALAYAQRHTKHVLSLILRGLFLGSKEEIDFFYQQGASFVFPENYEQFVSILTDDEKKDVLKSFYQKLHSGDPQMAQKAARYWTFWEASCLRLINTPKSIHEFAKPERCESLAKIETHYFMHGCFVRPYQLLEECHSLKDIPVTLVHGRYDMICPFKSAYLLRKQLPSLTLVEAKAAGHSGFEDEILNALYDVLEKI